MIALDVIGRVVGYVYVFGICVSLKVWFICRCEKFDVPTDFNASLDSGVDFLIAPQFFVISMLSLDVTVFKVKFAMVLWSARVVGDVCGELLRLRKLKMCAYADKVWFCELRMGCVAVCVDIVG